MPRLNGAPALLMLLAACARTQSVDATLSTPAPVAAPMLATASGAASATRLATAAVPSKYAKPSDAELRARLTPLQYEVTQREATEPPFHNDYWNNHEPGLYVDVATGQPLFSSQDKFESGTGWPSFTRPVDPDSLVSRDDDTFGMTRTEVVSSGGSHLGHVFPDGPAPTHQRYCINSASLRFIPVAELAAQGYGAYAARFGAAAVATEPPAAASNSCAVPPPGKKPGCSATLSTAIFSRSPRDARLAKTAGVLEVAPGYEGSDPAIEVTFDPSLVAYSQLVALLRADGSPAVAYVQDDAQRAAASAGGARSVEAGSFRRE